MHDWTLLERELTAHHLELTNGEVILHRKFDDPMPFNSIPAAIRYIGTKANDNTGFLVNLWEQLRVMGMSSFSSSTSGPRPTNEGTRRLFIAALKHLMIRSEQQHILMMNGTHRTLRSLADIDVAMFGETSMNQIIEFRLSIDWVSHLILYDRYRCELLEFAQKKPKAEDLAKVAFYLPTDLSYQRPIPWSQYQETLTTDARGDQYNPMTQDRTRWDDNRVKNRFSDRFDTIVGKHMVGDTPNDPLLPKDLPTEDKPAEQVWDDPNRYPVEWDKLDVDGNPGSGRLSVTGK